MNKREYNVPYSTFPTHFQAYRNEGNHIHKDDRKTHKKMHNLIDDEDGGSGCDCRPCPPLVLLEPDQRVEQVSDQGQRRRELQVVWPLIQHLAL
mmetsp:Transcript_30161/g.38748  ORF Transcript_30161/g.38748 Transcript_30161/m.38748 type:complete len:94 (+) Transcript_30161:767-1048(+)